MATSVIGTLRLALGLGTAEYESAWDKAEAKTRGSVGNINRLVQGFSGQKLIAEANKVATELEKIGGVSKLAGSELAKVSGVIDAAVAKFKALGQEVPANIAKIHGELKVLNAEARGASTGGIGSLASSMGLLRAILPVTTAAGAIAGIVRLGKEAFESASQISDLANKTGLSAEAVQRMQAVANQTGTSIEAFTNATFKLGVNVADGSKKARDAVQALGLSYDELRAKKPEEQFAAVVKALEQVDNQQERNRLGMVLFGKQFSEIAASIEEGYSGIADAARVTGAAQIKALDEAGDAWQRFKTEAAAATASFLGNLVLTLQAIERAGDALSATEKLKVFAADPFGYLTNLQKIGEEMKRQEQFAASNKPMLTHGTPEATKAMTDYVLALREAQKEVAGLSREQRTQLNAALKLGGEAAKEYADAIGLSEEGLRQYQAQLSASNSALKEHERDTKKSTEEQRKFNEAVHDFGRSAQPIGEVINKGWFGKIGEDIGFIPPILASASMQVGAFGQNVLQANEATLGWAEANDRLEDRVSAVTQTSEQFGTQLGELAQAFSYLAQTADGSIGSVLGWMGQLITSVNLAREATEALSDGFGQLKAGEIGQGLLSVATGALAAAAAMDRATDSGNAFQRGIGGAATGAQIGSNFGPVGTGVGAGIGFVIGLVRGLGAISEAVLKARADVADFQKTLQQTATDTQKNEAAMSGWGDRGALTLIQVRDALIGIGRKGEEAQALVSALWDTDHPDRARRAIEEINRVLDEHRKKLEEQEHQLQENKKAAGDLFDELMSSAQDAGGKVPAAMQPIIQKFIDLGLLTDDQVKKLRDLGTATGPSFDQMNDAIDVFKGRVESMGPAFNQQRIDQTAGKYVNALDTLARGGADVGGFLFDAKEELGALVSDAIRHKATLPAQLEPFIKRLIDTGQLIDENGDKIEDTSDLKFGEAIKTEAEIAKEGWERLITKMEEFFEKLGRQLDDVARRPPVDIDFRANLPPDLNHTMPEPLPLATGGIVRRPTFAVLAESEPEFVAPLRLLPSLMASAFDQVPAFDIPNLSMGSISGVKQSGTDEALLRMIWRTMEDFRRELPTVMRAAVQGAV